MSKDFNASVRLGILIRGILKLIFSGTRALTKLCSFRKSQFSAVEDVSRVVLSAH